MSRTKRHYELSHAAQGPRFRDEQGGPTRWYDDGAPLGLPVKGRPNTLTAHATADESGVTIRLDDGRDPAFWAEVRLDEGDLVHLLEQVREAQARP